MSTIPEQIAALEKEIRDTPYNKSTERHIGLLRAKIARLKEQEVQAASRGGGGGIGYAVKKQGDATVVLVGPPSVGKSTLINQLTNAKSKVAPYSFTTVSVIPGMMKYKSAMIQVLDVPGLIQGAEEGRGRGREVLSVVRGADLLVLMTDIAHAGAIENIAKSLERNGIRINKTPPLVDIVKKVNGGLSVMSNIKQDISRETIKDVANEFRIKNGEITIKQRVTMDELVDVFAGNRVYIPALFVYNKADIKPNFEGIAGSLKISAERGIGLTDLKEAIWEKLGLIRIYLVNTDSGPGDDNPMVVKRGMTLADIAQNIGTEFAAEKTKAKIWGPGAKFPGQEVSLKSLVTPNLRVRFL